jgi:hypothetical protein
MEAAFLPFLASCSAVRVACLGLAVSVAFVASWQQKHNCQRNLGWHSNPIFHIEACVIRQQHPTHSPEATPPRLHFGDDARAHVHILEGI